MAKQQKDSDMVGLHLQVTRKMRTDVKRKAGVIGISRLTRVLYERYLSEVIIVDPRLVDPSK